MAARDIQQLVQMALSMDATKLRQVLQHKLVRVTGRADVPGRPLQYGTTEHFLERFGLSSLQELPSVKEWKQLG